MGARTDYGTEAFWHPVMGAIDTMAQNIMEARKRKQAQAFEQQQTEQKRGWDVQDTDLRNRMGALENIFKSDDATPETRQLAMDAMIKEAKMPSMSSAMSLQSRGLDPLVSKGMPMIPGDQRFGLKQASDIESDYWRNKSTEQNIDASKSRTKSDKTRADAAMERAKNPGRGAGSIDQGKKSLQAILKSYVDEARGLKTIGDERAEDPRVSKYISKVMALQRKVEMGTVTEKDLKDLKSIDEELTQGDEFDKDTESINALMDRLSKKLAED